MTPEGVQKVWCARRVRRRHAAEVEVQLADLLQVLQPFHRWERVPKILSRGVFRVRAGPTVNEVMTDVPYLGGHNEGRH